MRALYLEPLHRLTGLAPLVVRVLVGIIMAAHGLQKLQVGPATFGLVLSELGVPLPTFMAYVVTLVEFVGGILLIVGLLSRFAALLLTIDLVMAILLVKVHVGLLSPQSGPPPGAELDLGLIAGFLVILLAGPGRLSLDYLLGHEGDVVQEEGPARRRGKTRRLPGR